LKADLHLHTTASDGRLTPEEVVMMAVDRGIEIIAITDHDTVGGVDRALAQAQKCPQITLIPGVEINTDLKSGELHVLGYFIDHKNESFISTLEEIRESRIARARSMIDKLSRLGIDLEWDRVQELAKGESICRPHIAQAMLEKGYVGTEKEAFDNYIGRNGPAYVEREKVQPADAVRLIRNARGLPVLAHPADIVDLDEILVELIAAGLVGIEAYYGQYDKKTVDEIISIAHRYNLIITGGTDYHHFCDGREVPMGSVNIPLDQIQKLFGAAGKTFKSANSKA